MSYSIRSPESSLDIIADALTAGPDEEPSTIQDHVERIANALDHLVPIAERIATALESIAAKTEGQPPR